MRILLVSDNPAQKSFRQITILRSRIRGIGKKVDLLTMSEEGYQLNRKHIGRAKAVTEVFKGIIRRNEYAAIAISLTKHNLDKLLSEEIDVIDLVRSMYPQTHIFVFGALSVLKRYSGEDSSRVHLYVRPGVDKLTKEFRDHLIECLEQV